MKAVPAVGSVGLEMAVAAEVAVRASGIGVVEKKHQWWEKQVQE